MEVEVKGIKVKCAEGLAKYVAPAVPISVALKNGTYSMSIPTKAPSPRPSK